MSLVVLGPTLDASTLDALAGLAASRPVCRTHAATGIVVARFDTAERTACEHAIARHCADHRLDHAWMPAAQSLADFRLFVTDMDSTLIDIECIDELADQAGRKAEVAAITEAAMQGALDFRASLRERVALLAGLPESALAQVYAHKLRLNPGAARLLAGLKAAGLTTVLVSGGFTFFTDRLKRSLGFDHAYANTLEIVDGRLTGRLTGDIVDAQAKADRLQAHRQALGIGKQAVMAAGDGANDLPMFRAAGLGIAYRAKPALRQAASLCLDYNGLDAVLAILDPCA